MSDEPRVIYHVECPICLEPLIYSREHRTYQHREYSACACTNAGKLFYFEQPTIRPAERVYACANPVTVSEDCLHSIAKVNFGRGLSQERERCAKIAETSWKNIDWPSDPPVCSRMTGERIAARIRSGEPA